MGFPLKAGSKLACLMQGYLLLILLLILKHLLHV